MNRGILMENALAYALKKGADACEIYGVSSNHDRMVVRNGALYDKNISDTQGFSVRLMKNGVIGFSYGAMAERDVLEQAVDSALLSCSFLEPDPYYHFTSEGEPYAALASVAHLSPTSEDKKEFLLTMEEDILGGKHIARADRCSIGEVASSVLLKNTLGLDLSFASHYFSSAAVAVAEDGSETETGSDFMITKSFSSLNALTIAKKAAENAQGKLHGITVSSGEYPVILDNEAVLDLLGIILPGFLGDNIRKGQSKLIGKLGKVITHSEFSLYDDGVYGDGVSSCPFDDQGVATRKTSLIEKGVVKSYLYDIASAAKAGTLSTGNGYTSSVKSLPTTGFGNYYLLGGSTAKETMIRQVDHGLYIKSFMGLHMANSVSGEFSLGIRGFLIEHGEIAQSIRGNMVAGDIFSLLESVESIGDDFCFYGYQGAPTLKIKSLKISGKS